MIHGRNIFLGAVIALQLVTAARADDALDPKPIALANATLQLPKTWTITPGGGGGGRTLLVANVPQPDKDPTGTFQATLAVTMDNMTGTLNGPAQQALVAQGVQNYKPVEAPSDVTFNGIAGVTFGGTFTNGALSLRSRQYMFVINKQLYVITFMCLNSRWPAYRSPLEASLSTFSVIKK